MALLSRLILSGISVVLINNKVIFAVRKQGTGVRRKRRSSLYIQRRGYIQLCAIQAGHSPMLNKPRPSSTELLLVIFFGFTCLFPKTKFCTQNSTQFAFTAFQTPLLSHFACWRRIFFAHQTTAGWAQLHGKVARRQLRDSEPCTCARRPNKRETPTRAHEERLTWILKGSLRCRQVKDRVMGSLRIWCPCFRQFVSTLIQLGPVL